MYETLGGEFILITIFIYETLGGGVFYAEPMC